jgi:DNA polymerase III psi subunit
LKHLYENTQLYEIPQTENSNLVIKGNNFKNVLVAVSSKDFNEKTEMLLKNILKAVSCNFPDDVTLILLKKDESICIKQLIDSYKSKYLLAFGLSANKLSLNIEKKVNHVFHISSTQMLLSPSLQTLIQNRDKKVYLWNQLKKMFS